MNSSKSNAGMVHYEISGVKEITLVLKHVSTTVRYTQNISNQIYFPLFLSEMKGSNSGRSEYHSEAGTYYNQTVTILVRLASLTIKQQGGSEDHQENILISQTESHLHHS